MTAHRKSFGSDNHAGAHDAVLAVISEANAGHLPAYGDDPWTTRATALLCEIFETDCRVFFVSTGTAANALALAALCQPFHSVFIV